MNKPITMMLVSVMLVVIAAMIIFERYGADPFIPEITLTDQFTYKGQTYVQKKGYVHHFRNWDCIGKTDNWEMIYAVGGTNASAPEMIYIDGEKPALYTSAEYTIPVRGEITAFFVYTDPDNMTDYRYGEGEDSMKLLSDILNAKGEIKDYQTDDFANTGRFVSFAYDHCAAGAAESQKYVICCLERDKYVFVPDAENQLTFYDDGSADFSGIPVIIPDSSLCWRSVSGIR